MENLEEMVTKGHQLAEETTKSSNRGEKCLETFTSSNGCVYGSLTLDIRKAGDYSQPLPVAVRVAHDGKKIFLKLGEKYKMDEWIQLCDYEKSGRRTRLAERDKLKGLFETVKDMTNQLIADGTFTLKKLQERFQGKKDEDTSIYQIWDEYIQEKKELKKIGSANVAKDHRNRFIKDNGEDVAFADIDAAFIQKWAEKMKKDGISISYIGMNLRTFRTIVNMAIRRDLIKGTTKEMFRNTGYNKTESCKHKNIDVETMRQLYDFWEKGEAVDENGKELFSMKEKQALFRDLGLFLFMYLGDGQNLADTLRLEYDNIYFSSHGKQLHFLRNKTRERNAIDSEVIFPITPEMQKILDKYANVPKLGQRVFPIMSPSISAETEMWTIQRYNRYIRKHMLKVAEMLGLQQKLSSTWARHSFANNLNGTGNVPYKYISDSMGHSSGGDITSNYIGDYPLKKMLEYNNYLLNEDKPVTSKEALLDLLKGMSAEERAALMEEASK